MKDASTVLKNTAGIIARSKIIADRQRGYYAWGSIFMVGYLFIDRVGWRWQFMLVIPLLIVWAWFDDKYIRPAERTELDEKSGVLNEIRGSR